MDADGPAEALTHDRAFDAVDAGAEPAESSPEQPVEGAPSDNTTLVSVLRTFEDRGFTDQLIAGSDGTITCVSCNESFPASQFHVEASRRLEGASDPDDMMTVVAARCPRCGTAGTLVLGYGPNASEEDIGVYRAFGVAITDPARATAHAADATATLDPDAPGASLFRDGDAVEPNEPA